MLTWICENLTTIKTYTADKMKQDMEFKNDGLESSSKLNILGDIRRERWHVNMQIFMKIIIDQSLSPVIGR